MTYFRHLETTPFCPADIFPREGARSYRRMGIITIIFSAPASPLPLHGECRRDRRPEGESQRVGDLLQLDELLRIKGSLFCFLEGESNIFQTLKRKAAEFFFFYKHEMHEICRRPTDHGEVKERLALAC